MSNQLMSKLAGAQAPANSSVGSQPQQKDATVAVISAVGAVVASVVSGIFAHRTNERNIDLMHEQNQWNLDQWNRENAYNLPTSQVSRLRAAGLNPALIYGNGIMNEAANSQPAADAPTMRPELSVDPLTASQISLNEAQAESLRHNTDREDEKQPMTIEQLKTNIEECRSKTNEILQNIKNLKMDEQIKSYQYLRDGVQYLFETTTFNDMVKQVKVGLDAAKLGVDMSAFELSKAMQMLSYQLVGLDLSNKNARAGLNLSLQQYRQSEELFDSIMKKYSWDAEKSFWEYSNEASKNDILARQGRLFDAEFKLKDLSFWIEARNNPNGYKLYEQFNLGNHSYINAFMYDWIRDFTDIGKHGLKLPISFGIH